MSRNCPSCQTSIPKPSFICRACEKLLPFQDLDPFAILNLEARFDVDPRELEQAYFSSQRQVHPDRFVKTDSEVKTLASRWSTHLNEAYQTLKDPLKRGHALYKVLHGAHPPESSEDTDLLQDMMALQEALMEDPAKGQEQVRAQQETCLQDLQTGFENKKEAIPALLERYSYLQRLKR